MLKEYAIIPDVFDESVLSDRANAGTLINFLQGISENGLLANLYKGKWNDYVVNYKIPNINMNTRDLIKVNLNRLYDRKRLVRHPKRFTDEPKTDLQWLVHALASHEVAPFSGIALSQATLDEYGTEDAIFININEVIDLSQWQDHSRSAALLKCKADYQKYLKPILSYARKVELVDPHMRYNSNHYKETLKIVFEILGTRNQDVELYIHTSGEGAAMDDNLRKREADICLDSWEQVLNELNIWHYKECGSKINTYIKVFIWGERYSGKRFHDRYILTDQCGVSTPYGLDCQYKNSQLNSTTWSLMDEKVRLTILDEYSENTSPYILLGDREMILKELVIK